MPSEPAVLAQFFVPGTPKGQGSLSSFKHPRTGAIITPQNKKVMSWRGRIAALAQLAYDEKPLECAVSIHLCVIFKRPQAHYNAMKEIKEKFEDMLPAGKTNDVDKHARSVLDALTGIIYDDDGRVTTLVAIKRYEGPDTQPGVEIQVTKDTL